VVDAPRVVLARLPERVSSGDPGITTTSMRVSRIVVILYVLAGIIVAAQRDYFENLDTAKRIISAVLAVVLWPLVLAGVDVRLN
jgi:hypothetical protein